jgi:membrane-associated phospholipid phosphatase
MKKLVLAFCLLYIPISSFANSALTTTGDVLQIAIPASAYGLTFYKDDEEGRKQFYKSFLTNTAITYALKFSLKSTSLNERPNGKDYSFPSGHAASAYQGAFFMQERYGYKYGAPAIALATLTGYSRVESDNHHWRDVIGAAVIAFGVNHYFVTKHETQKLTFNLSTNEASLNFATKF